MILVSLFAHVKNPSELQSAQFFLPREDFVTSPQLLCDGPHMRICISRILRMLRYFALLFLVTPGY